MLYCCPTLNIMKIKLLLPQTFLFHMKTQDLDYCKISYFVFQMLLRAKENEVQYLKKEISCLQGEVQSLTKVRFMCLAVLHIFRTALYVTESKYPLPHTLI